MAALNDKLYNNSTVLHIVVNLNFQSPPPPLIPDSPPNNDKNYTSWIYFPVETPFEKF